MNRFHKEWWYDHDKNEAYLIHEHKLWGSSFWKYTDGTNAENVIVSPRTQIVAICIADSLTERKEWMYLFCFYTIGVSIGYVIGMFLSGVLCEHGFAGGWPSAFYVIGRYNILFKLVYFVYICNYIYI